MLLGVGEASAQAVLSTAGHTLLEQRLAFASTPGADVLWLSARIDVTPGDVGMVLPVPDASALDYASASWMEALDEATAPRVFPPSGVVATCPDDETAHPFASTVVGAQAVLPPVEVIILNTASDVLDWTDERGLVISPLAVAALSSANPPFVGFRFSSRAGGEAVTATVRVAAPPGSLALPLSLLESSSQDALVTAFVFGPGRSAVVGAVDATVSPVDLTFFAAGPDTDYPVARLAALQSSGTVLVESASYASVVQNVPIARGTGEITGVLTAYFEGAAAYGDGAPNATRCIATAGAALSSTTPIAPACPRADLGHVGAISQCVESVDNGEADPALLRCGPGADDLAVAFGGAVPTDIWLTRVSSAVPASQMGSDQVLATIGGPGVSPVVSAGAIDLVGCGGEGGNGDVGGAGNGSGSGNAPGTGAGPAGVGNSGPAPGTGQPTTVPVYQYDGGGCGCSGTYVLVDSYDTYESDPPEAAYRDDDGDCGGDTETYADESYEEDEDCGGGEPTPSESESADDEDCGGDTSETGDTGDDGSADDGSYDTSSDGDCGGGEPESSSSDDGGCGSDTGDTSGDDSCRIATPAMEEGRAGASRRGRPPRLSQISLMVFGLLFPLRRLRRRNR